MQPTSRGRRKVPRISHARVRPATSGSSRDSIRDASDAQEERTPRYIRPRVELHPPPAAHRRESGRPASVTSPRSECRRSSAGYSALESSGFHGQIQAPGVSHRRCRDRGHRPVQAVHEFESRVANERQDDEAGSVPSVPTHHRGDAARASGEMGKRCSRIHDHGKKVDQHHEISKADCPNAKHKACVKRANIATAMTNLAAALGVVTGFFTMEIDWHEDDPGCACCCGEYRQFVKGFVKINGTKQKKKLFNGKLLSETDFVEDSDDKNHPYGHRDLAEAVNDKFIPDPEERMFVPRFRYPRASLISLSPANGSRRPSNSRGRHSTGVTTLPDQSGSGRWTSTTMSRH